MKFVFLTDIYGISEHVELIAKRLGGDVSFISPYERESEIPNNKDAVYEYFHSVSSIEKYTQKVRCALEYVDYSVMLVGFSIGATVGWRISGDSHFPIRNSICIFGSRIRDYLNVKPIRPISLFFSNDEKYFINKLEYSDWITIELVNCAHSAISEPNGCNIAVRLINKALR
ncbi:hypothetical protein [Photorhabdus tasmaniensis]|uniref:Dienelactone hydrolase domain-containing protein n=1 Tax=Photorhabdus tasmaniensis TaxID=1004159 RepID=A0ABX0GJM4_9GAMM|nr:hypothetical protein [Photorhabdus tasmaniensis]NHB89410.1 hypothetical protein [Photorhabdus tasmaniensis]